MDKIKKLTWRIARLQEKLTMTALLQRNYRRHFGKNKAKYDKDAEQFISIMNELRKELMVEKQKKEVISEEKTKNGDVNGK